MNIPRPINTTANASHEPLNFAVGAAAALSDAARAVAAVDGDDDADVWRQLLGNPRRRAVLVRVHEEGLQRIYIESTLGTVAVTGKNAKSVNK